MINQCLSCILLFVVVSCVVRVSWFVCSHSCLSPLSTPHGFGFQLKELPLPLELQDHDVLTWCHISLYDFHWPPAVLNVPWLSCTEKIHDFANDKGIML